MAQLNYSHLYYFFTVAREGSIVKAAEVLHLTPQTISGQLSVFENQLGVALFDRKGKRLILNDSGKLVFSYADDIFALGHELQQSLTASEPGLRHVLTVGVIDVIPKILAFDILQHGLDLQGRVKLVCREGDFDALLAELVLNKIDIILSDRPLSPGIPVKAYNHRLGHSGLSFYTDRLTAGEMIDNFPRSMHQRPFLISGDKSVQKISLLSWFDQIEIRPDIIAEFDDSALMKFFGQSGYGVFSTPTAIEAHVLEQYDVSVIGRTTDIGENFFAISPERKLKHQGVKMLVEKGKLFFQSNGADDTIAE